MQDEREGIIYAEETGRLREVIALVIHLLKKRFAEIPGTISIQIEDLLLEDLESLMQDILDFNSFEDLESCLEEHSLS